VPSGHLHGCSEVSEHVERALGAATAVATRAAEVRVWTSISLTVLFNKSEVLNAVEQFA